MCRFNLERENLMIRVFIITQDEPVYTPVYIQKIIQKTPHSIVGITALSPSGNTGWIKLAKQRLNTYGLLDFIKAVSLFGFYKLRSYWPIKKVQGRFYSVNQLAAHYSIKLFPHSNINTKDYIRQLKDLNIDILLSVAANQRFKRNLLEVPRLACLNVHSALLPKYRGLDGLFWALVHGETEVGVTVHIMNENFDDGSIVGQQAFTVNSDDTLHRLYFKAIEAGSTLISQVMDQYASGTVSKKPNNKEEGSYFSWPDRESARCFRNNGFRFF